MIEEFKIPGMVLTRDDVASVLIKHYGTDKAMIIAKNLSDDQMMSIADVFSQSLFDGTDIFITTLRDVVDGFIGCDIIEVDDET